MVFFPWRRASGLLLATASCALLLGPWPAAAAQRPVQHASADACAPKLNGYQPLAETTYGTVLGNNLFYLNEIKEDSNGDISGSTLFIHDNYAHPGTFKGRIESGKIHVQGSKNTAGWSFSFTGKTTCLLSQLETTNLTTDPAGKLPASLKLTSVCVLGAPFGIGIAESLLPACKAREILDGIPQPNWDNGRQIPDDGRIPYSWFGGHPHSFPDEPANGNKPGPSIGSCHQYTGTHQADCATWKDGPTHTFGLDCSGFTRWVFYLLMYKDVLGGGGTGSQVTGHHLMHVTKPEPGDLVYFKNKSGWFHVGILIGPNEMIQEPKTLSALKVTKVSAFLHGGVEAVYYQYPFPAVG
jgi:NlpC/P60 family protein